MVVGPAAKLPPDHLWYDRHSIPSKFIINQRVKFRKILRVEWNNSISEVCTNQLCILEVVQDSIWPMRHCKPLNSHLQISVCLQPLCIKFNLSLPSSVHLVSPKNIVGTCASLKLSIRQKHAIPLSMGLSGQKVTLVWKLKFSCEIF